MLQLRTLPLLLASLCSLADVSSAGGPGYGRHGSKSSTCAVTRAVWVPGHHERVERRRWVPGGTRREWLPAQTREVCTPWGGVRLVVLRPARWVLVAVPGRYETSYEDVWVPGSWTHVPL